MWIVYIRDMDFSELLDEFIAEIKQKLNNRPSKSLGYLNLLEYCRKIFNFDFNSVALALKFSYSDKQIVRLKSENAELKKRCLALEESLKDTKKDLLTTITKWDDTVNRLHNAYNELYKTRAI